MSEHDGKKISYWIAVIRIGDHWEPVMGMAEGRQTVFAGTKCPSSDDHPASDDDRLYNAIGWIRLTKDMSWTLYGFRVPTFNTLQSVIYLGR